jgi:hypothetical protein
MLLPSRRMKLHTIFLKQFQEPTEDNYGRYIEDLKAYDAKGTLLTVKKLIFLVHFKAKTLEKITYLVNDSFDTERYKIWRRIFSPAGSNIDAGKNIMLNALFCGLLHQLYVDTL